MITELLKDTNKSKEDLLEELKVLRAQLVLIEEEKKKEIKYLEQLTSSPNKSDIAEKLFSLEPLKSSFPGIFNDIVKHYEDLLNLSVKEKEDNSKQMISDELKIISEELFRLKAGPSDVMEVHNTVIKKKNKETSNEKPNLLPEKAILIVLELMSNLVYHYRKHSLILKGSNGKKTILKI